MREKKTVLEDFHPIILLAFFVPVMSISMFDESLITGLLSALTSLIFLAFLLDPGKYCGVLIRSLLISFLLAVTNPIFSHNGATELFFVNGQAYTLEAMLYGLHMGLMLTSVFNWFQIQTICMGSDKWLYLTGRIAPGLALMFSMVLRLIPVMKNKYSEMKQADEGLLGQEKNSWGANVVKHLRLFLGMAGWTLEYMPEVSASMKARGYGSRKRTTLSVFSFRFRETVMLLVILALTTTALIIKFNLAQKNYYYPLCVLYTDNWSVLFYIFTGLLFVLPSIVEGADRVQWMYYRSKI